MQHWTEMEFTWVNPLQVDVSSETTVCMCVCVCVCVCVRVCVQGIVMLNVKNK